MILLQAAMAAGLYLVVFIAIAILIGVPLLTFIVSAFLSKRNENLEPNETSSTTNRSQTTPPSKQNRFWESCLIAVAIMTLLVILGLAALAWLVPNFE